MTDKEKQLERLREAVDRKAEAADDASHESPDRSGPAPEEEGRPGEAHSPREQGGGKDKMTADRWNQ
jgi:hypothetical protein